MKRRARRNSAVARAVEHENAITRARGEREDAVVRTDEPSAVRLDRDRPARSAHTRIDDREVNGAARERVCRSLERERAAAHVAGDIGGDVDDRGGAAKTASTPFTAPT